VPNKAIALMGTRGYVDGISLKSTTDAICVVGNSTGNLDFQYVNYNLIKGPKLVIGLAIPWDVSQVRQTPSWRSANFILERFEFTGFVEFLELTELSVIFLGLGAMRPISASAGASG